MTVEEAMRQLEALREFTLERLRVAEAFTKDHHTGRHEVDFLRGQMSLLHRLLHALRTTGRLGQ